MTNFEFNGSDARALADRIIAKEESYIKTDFSSLSLEDKCRFIATYNGAHHPLFRIMDLRNEFAELYRELLRRTSKREDGFSLYHLYVLCHILKLPRQKGLEFLVRAHKAYYPDARLAYADWISKSNSEKRDIAEELLTILSLGDITEKDSGTLYHAYVILSEYGHTSDDRSEYGRLADEIALKSVLRGEYVYLPHLCAKGPCVPMREWDDEKIFWKTVSFMVNSTLYDRYSVHYGEILGIQMLRGIGCEPDAQRAKAFFLDVFFRAPIDRAKALDMLNASAYATLDDLREDLRRNAVICDPCKRSSAYAKLILADVLRGDRDAVAKTYDKALILNRDNMVGIMTRTHSLLRRASV